MNLAHESSKLLITGASGSGKSTYLHRYVMNATDAPYRSIFIFDNEGEFSYRLGKPSCRSVEELEKSLETGLTIFDPSELFPGETPEAWNFFCEWTFAFAKQNLHTGEKLLVCDELQVVTSTATLPFETSLIVETGRRYQLDFAGVSQQLNLIHNRMRNQLTELVTFRQEDKLVLTVLDEKGFNIDHVRTLKPGQFLWRNFKTGEIGAGSIDLGINGRLPKQTGENTVDNSGENPDDSTSEAEE